MIKYNPKSWIHLIFALQKSDTARILWKELLYMAALSLIIAYIEIDYFPDTHLVLSNLTTVFSLIGFVISMLLVFRTNTAYDRWWEGRKKWGELVNDTRNLSVKLSALIAQKEDRLFFARMIGNFVFASKEHLREGINWQELDLTEEETKHLQSKDHIPMMIVQLMYQKIIALKKSGEISEMEFIALDTNLNALMNSLGACERIKNTPIPYSYSLFLKKFIFIYTSTLPLAFVTIFGYYSAIISVFVFYVIVSMEVLAEEIEDPFGTDENDLPTDQLCEKIRTNAYEALG